MTIQSDFVDRLRNAVSNVITVVDQVEILRQVAVARGYQNWTNADLTGIEVNGEQLTMTELLAVFARFAELKAYMDNQAVATMDRRTTFNKFRGDI